MYLDTIKPILKEIKVLSNQYKLEGHTDYHNKAREEINKKYGKGWRGHFEGVKGKVEKMSYY
jgi:hypothetical protein